MGVTYFSIEHRLLLLQAPHCVLRLADELLDLRFYLGREFRLHMTNEILIDKGKELRGKSTIYDKSRVNNARAHSTTVYHFG